MPQSNQMRENIPYAVANATEVPLTFHQAITEVPKGQFTTVLPPSVQLTDKSSPRTVKRNATVVSHWLNLPFVDGLRSVASIYKIVSAAAFNYQRTHQDAFFEAYPELLIRKSTESLATHDLRHNYKLYSKRIAHWWYEYGEAKKMQLGALVNLLNLTRYNGNETFKNIATDVRWSRINSNCVLAERFPTPKGCENYVISKSKYASGKTTYGSDIVSIPLWITDIFGNRHSQEINLDNFIISNQDGKIKKFGASFDAQSNPVDELAQVDPAYSKLVDNMINVAFEFGFPDANASLKAFNGSFSTMPRIQNGASRVIKGQLVAAESRLNLSSDPITFQPGKFGCTSDITKRLWAMYDMWTAHLVKAFPQMMDPNNDRYTFAIEQLHLFEPSSKNEDILKALRAHDNFDIGSLAELMTFKARNSANTATFVKFAPALYGIQNLTASYADYFDTDAAIEENCERYDVDSPDIAKIISSAKEWPHINPTTFTDDVSDSYAPIVANVAMSAGCEFIPTSDRAVKDRYIAPIGKFATLIDMAVSSSVAPELSTSTGYGVTEEFFNKYIEDGNAIVYEEDPSTVWVMSQPLIDSSDLAQCGFNIIIADDDPNPSEWAMSILNQNQYDLAGSMLTATGEIQSAGDAGPISPGVGKSYVDPILNVNVYMRQHVANPIFKEAMHHALVFIGVGVFNHPLEAITHKAAGYFVQQHHAKVADSAEIALFEEFYSETTLPTPLDTLPYARALAWNTIAQSAGSCDQGVGVRAAAKDQWTNDEMNVLTFIFAPEYGPVLISSCDSPMINPQQILPHLGSTYNSEFSSKPFQPKIAQLETSNGGSVTAVTGDIDVSTARPILYNPLFSPMEWLIFFLNTVQFPKVKPNGFGSYDVSQPANVVSLAFGTISKWAFTITSRVKAQFVGLHDTKPFWIDISMDLDDIAIASSNRFPENNILAEPRRVQAKGRIISGRVTGGKSNDKDEISYQAAGFKGNNTRETAGSKHKAGGRKRNFRKPSKTAAKVDTQTIEINSDATTGNQKGSELADFGGGKIGDYSREKTDRDVNRDKKKPLDTVSVI